MSYNGWSNKETWLVNLWLGDMFTMDQEEGIEITADYIEEEVQNCLPNTEELIGPFMDLGFFNDLLNCALGEINYHEIAEHYKQEELEDA